jgi:hypothetical protein
MLPMSNLMQDEPIDDPDACALDALEIARSLPNGAARIEALKKAGLLRQQADRRGITFAKKGRPRKG